MPQYTITLEHQGKHYSFLDTFNYEGWRGDTERDPDGQVLWMYGEGNYSCDCNLSMFIRQYCDEAFPDLECGRTIKLVSIKQGERALKMLNEVE